MARRWFGGAPADWTISTATVLDSGAVSRTAAVLEASTSLQVWNAATGGTQLTDLLSAAGGAITTVTTDSAGRVPRFQGPDAYEGDAWIVPVSGGTRTRLTQADLGVRLAALETTGAAIPNTIYVAASDATTTQKALAGPTYTCDGTADQVQIQAAITATVAAGGGLVLLSPGTFNIAASINLNGTGEVDDSVAVQLRGAGNYSTTLAGAANVTVISISQIGRVQVSDMALTISGSGIGINAVAVDDATYWRSFDESIIERIWVTGGYSGHTGTAMRLGSAFRSSVRDLHIEGVKYGIEFPAENEEQNPGDCDVARMMIGVSEANGAAYIVRSPASSMNQMFFSTCHAFADPTRAGTVGWLLDGAFGSNHIQLRNCNIEQFATTWKQDSGMDARVQFVHVTQRNGSMLFDVGANAFWGTYEVGELYAESSAAVVVIDDDSTYSHKPNTYSIQGYADTGSSLTADLGVAGHVVAGAWDGPGTVAAALKRPRPVGGSRVITLTDAATIATNAALGTKFRCSITANRALGVPTNPTDGQEATWWLTASGGARTPTLATGAGGFVGATPTSVASGSTGELIATYDASASRWRVRSWVVTAAS